MSLLWMDYEDEFKNLVDTAHRYEQEDNAEYFAGLSTRVRKIIYRDTRYNVDFLYTAYVLHEPKIMTDYAVWLYQLMDSVLKDLNAAQSAEYVIHHLAYIEKAVRHTVSEEKVPALTELLKLAADSIRRQVEKEETVESGNAEILQKDSEYEAEIELYMETLFAKDTRRALALIQEFEKKEIPPTTIYVDTEHYCTSVTQMAMAQMYPVLFSSERKNRTILCACPGTELHEIGARMVTDVFENDGWNGIFLGAAVPQDALLASIRENQPDLLALSVTMPQHLMTCEEMIGAVRKEFPQIKIAVGGGAFKSTEELWKQWPVDFYTEDARELLEKANAAFMA